MSLATLGLIAVDVNDGCNGLLPLFRFLRKGIYPVFLIGIPILLIIMGTVDLGKAVIASDDKAIKMATGQLGKRFAAAVVVFLLVLLIDIVLNWLTFVGDEEVSDTASWKTCWTEAGK